MVRAKKHLGQHFLKDQHIARDITQALTGHGGYQKLLEIGPGTGVLTAYLLEQYRSRLWMIELDRESVAHLKKRFPETTPNLIQGDYLQWQPEEIFQGKKYGIIGNFPYRISSQIFFKILQTPQSIPEVVCMLQKEVAQRLASPPGSRKYGILSVLLQAFYKVDYLFEVKAASFHPPPKVDSAVIRLQSLPESLLDCDPELFRSIVKRGFQNRRKTLRNALKAFNLPPEVNRLELLGQRAEQLSVEDYVALTNLISPFWNP